ncbi:MAG: 2-hydroxyacyl-CoA dehydratase [Clostridiaceae bacterium]|nr:2-hydroxyacyl-CoA dehydratase [Clostridiaceae bacterium]
MSNLPEMFHEFSEARQKGFMEIKALKEQGKKVVGIYCTYTPIELIMASDAIPIGLCGTSEEVIPEAEKHLPRNLCPLIKSSYGHAITDTCPYFYFSDLLVGETTCDGKKKMYEYLGEIKPMHVMQLPQTMKDKNAFKVWRDEIVLLKEHLEKELEVEITEEKLKAAIKERNKERRVLKEFYELGKLCPPPITGTEMFQVLYGSEFKVDRQEKTAYIKNMIKEIQEKYEENKGKVSPKSPRILITGCPIGGVSEKILKTIEENGGTIVCFENCSGVKSTDRLVDETIHPIDALTEKYLNIPCSVMSPNKDRLELLSKLIDEYKIDGVIEVILQACHTYNVESYSIKKFVNEEKNKPYLYLETDYSQSDTGQLKTRIAAFLEMM